MVKLLFKQVFVDQFSARLASKFFKTVNQKIQRFKTGLKKQFIVDFESVEKFTKDFKQQKLSTVFLRCITTVCAIVFDL